MFTKSCTVWLPAMILMVSASLLFRRPSLTCSTIVCEPSGRVTVATIPVPTVVTPSNHVNWSASLSGSDERDPSNTATALRLFAEIIDRSGVALASATGGSFTSLTKILTVASGDSHWPLLTVKVKLSAPSA